MPNRLKREGDYLLIFRHDSSGGDFFGSKAEARSTGTPESIKFSALNALEHFRRKDGKFQFKLVYPEYPELTNVWKQQSNFAALDSGNYIKNGIIAGGLDVVENGHKSGTWSTLIKENPGTSDYVLEHTSAASAQEYRIDIPQSRLQPNKTYTLTAWVGFEDTADRNKGIFHARWYDGSSNPIASSSLESGDPYLSNGNSYVMDGITWERRYFRFTTPSTLANTNMFWYLGYSSASGGEPAGKRYFTNIQVLDVPVRFNYMGDYTATARGVVGYEAIDVKDTSNRFIGIEYNTSTQSLADGCNGSSWWRPIGAISTYGDGTQQPGPGGHNIYVTELWVYAPLGAAIHKDSMYASHFTESGHNENVLAIQGIPTSGFGVTTNPYVYMNDVNHITSHTPKKGHMYVIRFNKSLELITNHKFECNTAQGRTNMARELNNIKGNKEIVAIVSSGDVVSDANVDAAMAGYGSDDWRGADFYSKYSYSYAAILRADLGIISERTNFDIYAEDVCATKTVFNTLDDLGSCGYGAPLLEEVGVDGTSIDFDISNVQEGQYVMLTCYGQRSEADAAAGTSRWCSIYWEDAGGNSIGTDVIRTNSTSGQKYTIYSKRPVNAASCHLWSNGVSKGFRSVYRAGFAVPSIDKISTSPNGVASFRLAETPTSGSPWTPDSWYTMATSNSNLLQTAGISQDESNSVYWGNKTLTDDNEKSYMLKTNEDSVTTGLVTGIDDETLYHCSWWVNYKATSEAKNLLFQLRCQDSSNAYLGVTDAITGTSSSTFPRLASFKGSQISPHLNEWILVQGWIVPNSWSLDKIKAFANTHSYYFGTRDSLATLDSANGGIGLHNDPGETAYSGFLKIPSGTEKVQLRLDDRDNAGNATEFATALPCITPVVVAAADQDTAYTQDFTEYWEWRYHNTDNNATTGSYATGNVVLQPGESIEFFFKSDLADRDRWNYLIDGNSPRCHVAITTTDTWSYSTGVWDIELDGYNLVNGQAFDWADGTVHHMKLTNKSAASATITHFGSRYTNAEAGTMTVWGMKTFASGVNHYWRMDDGPGATEFADAFQHQPLTIVNPDPKYWSRVPTLI